MKYKFFFPAILVVALAGCGGKAVTFNNKIADIEASVRADAQKGATEIEDYGKNQDWDKVTKEAKKIENEFNDKISELKDLEAPDLEGASKFKKAEVAYMTSMKNLFTGYRKVGEAENDQDRQTEIANLTQVNADIDAARNEVKSAQADFAKANDVKMEEKTTTDDDKTTKKKKSDD